MAEPRPRQRIRLFVADAAARYLGVEHTVEHVDTDQLRLRMPIWCPGSYLVREYAGHVSRFDARSGDRRLAFAKSDKTTWEIETDGADRVTVSYLVYAPELTVRTNDVTPEHAFVHPPATFLVAEGRDDDAIELRVEAPDGWTVSTALERRGDAFVARDYDRLADCPLEIGPHEVHRFDVAGRPHEFAVHGDGNLDVDRMLADAKKIVQTEVDFFGGEPPYERYLFVLHLTHDRGGGLEHEDSCVLGWPKLGFRPEDEYRKFLTLIAHEFFHVWNVKRIRPDGLVVYDWFRETYTSLLWVFEGFTTYYDELFPVRAGCYEARALLEHMADSVAKERQRGGGRVQSLEEGSFDAWIGLYRQTPDSPHTQVHYYLKGMLVAWKLDLHLRAATDGAKSLDDVVRHLWTEYGKSRRGVPEGGMAAIIETATGVDVRDFLREHVERPGELRYDEALAHLGLRLRRKASKPDEPASGWLGAQFESTDGGARLTSVEPGGPAHTGGLTSDDVLIALDGHRVGRGLGERLKVLRPGESVTWSVFRRDRLVEGRLTLGEDPVGTLEIVPLESVDDRHRDNFRRWCGGDLDALSTKVD